MKRSTFLDKNEVKLTIRLTALLFFIPLMQSIAVGNKSTDKETFTDSLFLNKLVHEKAILIYFLGEPLKEFLFTFLLGLMQGASDTKAALITIFTGRKLALNNKSSKAKFLALERTKQQIRLLPRTSFVLFQYLE